MKVNRQNNWPEKLVRIVYAVFNKPLILDHATYVKEDGLDIFYSEPYSPVDITKIDVDKAKCYGVQLIPLKRSMRDSATYPYKIIISNPNSRS